MAGFYFPLIKDIFKGPLAGGVFPVATFRIASRTSLRLHLPRTAPAHTGWSAFYDRKTEQAHPHAHILLARGIARGLLPVAGVAEYDPHESDSENDCKPLTPLAL